MNSSELGTKKVSELREIATQLGIAGNKSMKKAELIELIAGGINTLSSESEVPANKQSSEEDTPKKKRKISWKRKH